MLIKAGTYKFNKVLTHGEFSQDIPFSTAFTLGDITGTVNCTRMYNYVPNENYWCLCFWATTFYDGETLVKTFDGEEEAYSYSNLEKSSEWIPHFTRTHTIKENTEVDDGFGTWYVTNTDYNEVNGIDKDYRIKESTLRAIANEYRAVLDVPDTFDPEEMDTKIADAYNKGYEVGTGEGAGTPIPIATESELNALLDTSTVGTIYQYTGETTDTYEKDGLYQVDEVSE